MKKSSEEQGSRIRSGLAGACVMVLLTAGLLWGSEAWYRAAFGKYETRVAPYGTVTAEQELPLPAYAADYGVRRLAAGRDASGALLAYAVETAVEGYAGREIVIRAEIQADGELLREMRVLSQKEDRYYGDRIALDSFAERFEGCYLPLLLPGQAGRGCRVDALSGATGSSTAVFRAVNQAYAFLLRALGEGELP